MYVGIVSLPLLQAHEPSLFKCLSECIDPMCVQVPDVAKAMELGREAAAHVSKSFPPPVKLEFEKVHTYMRLAWLAGSISINTTVAHLLQAACIHTSCSDVYEIMHALYKAHMCRGTVPVLRASCVGILGRGYQGANAAFRIVLWPISMSSSVLYLHACRCTSRTCS